jgi:hypothetical protein
MRASVSASGKIRMPNTLGIGAESDRTCASDAKAVALPNSVQLNAAATQLRLSHDLITRLTRNSGLQRA